MFNPQGINTYSSLANTKLIEITIARHAWLDRSTCRSKYDLTHTYTTLNHKLLPVGGPLGFCNKMKIGSGAPILEGIAMYNCAHAKFNIFSGADRKNNYCGEGFSYDWEDRADV